MAKYLGRRRKAGQALQAPQCHCSRVGDTHAVVAISTTIMERGIHSPKQLTTDTTWGRCELGTLPLPPLLWAGTPWVALAPRGDDPTTPTPQLTVGAELLQRRVFILMGQRILRVR